MSVLESDLAVRHLAQRLEEKERELEELRARLAAWRAQFDAGEKRNSDFTGVSGRMV